MLCLTAALGCATPPAKTPKMDTDAQIYEKGMDKLRMKNYVEAIPVFEELRDKYPMSPYAVLAELRLGDSHYHKYEYIEAAHFFDNFRRLHPSNPQVDYSIFMRGLCAYQQMLSCDRDQTFAEEALEQFQQLVELFPQSPYAGRALMRIAEARRLLAEREIFVADFYMRKLNYAGAIERYNRALKRYPNQVKEDQLLLKIGEATIRGGNERRGVKILEYLVEHFPDSSAVPEAQKIIDDPATGLKEIPWVTRHFN